LSSGEGSIGGEGLVSGIIDTGKQCERGERRKRGKDGKESKRRRDKRKK